MAPLQKVFVVKIGVIGGFSKVRGSDNSDTPISDLAAP